MFGTDPISELGLPLFSIQSVPGKGKGLVARFNIGKGKRILFAPYHNAELDVNEPDGK